MVDCDLIGFTSQFHSCECAYEHEQGTSWKVKVSNQSVKATKDVAWLDE